MLRVAQKCSWPHFSQCIYVFFPGGWRNSADGVFLKLTHSLAGSHMQQFKLELEQRWKLRSDTVNDVQPLVMRETDTIHWAPNFPMLLANVSHRQWKQEEVNGEKWLHTAGSRMSTKQLPKLNRACSAATRTHVSSLTVWIFPTGLSAMLQSHDTCYSRQYFTYRWTDSPLMFP